MIRSMTGFGSAEGDVGGSRVNVEVRTVNHRFFNPSVKLPSAFARWEAEVRESLRKQIARGHVTTSAHVEAPAGEPTKMREAEGARLAAVLLERMAVIEEAVGRIAARAPERVIAQRDRLRENVKVLAEGVAVDEQRLAQEIAILADRLDVGEEIDRFRAHVAAFRDVLAPKGGEPVGKRLGFLLQEMLREANTTGSKANDALIQRDVLLVKEELERIREQAENVE